MSGKPETDPHAATLAVAAAAAERAASTLTEAGARVSTVTSTAMEGRHFAHFRVDRHLGKGGMGEVYLATDVALDRKVALKLLPRDLGKDPLFRERFVREARAQARVQHPNVCHIYFIGEQDDQLFFAMELVDGETVQQRLDREGKLPIADAISICRQAALGLAAAHREGFIHRDVKPSNLLMDRDGLVKIADFGLVKSVAGAPGETEAGAGTIVGTPLYMSPEQARGEAVDFRSDIYALGATLHQLVAGEPPFQGASPLAVVSKHASSPRPKLDTRGHPRRAAAHVNAVDAVVERMMAKRPEDRFGSYADLIAALDRLSPQGTRPAGFFVRSFAAGLDAMLVGAVAGLLAFVLPHLDALDVGLYPWLAALYVIVCHARWGRTIGKAALEIEVVADARPGARGIGFYRAVLRWLAEWGPIYVTLTGLAIVDRAGLDWTPLRLAATLAAGVVLGGIVVTAMITAGQRTLWDRFAGTRTMYRRPSAG